MNLNLLRCLAASIFFWMIIPFYPGTKALSQTPATPLLYLILSAVIGIAVGDTIYFRCLRLINVTLAFPIAQSAMPLMTLGAAVLFLEEPITWLFALGTFLVLGGIYLIIAPDGKTRLLLKGRILERRGVGISLILLAASFWTISISLLKVSLQQVNLVLANGIRLPVASLLLIILVLMQNPIRQPTKRGFRDISLGAFAGLLSFGVGGILFLWAIQTAGVGKAAVLTSSAPLFGLPLAGLCLKEQVTRKIIFGTVLVVLGIIFLV